MPEGLMSDGERIVRLLGGEKAFGARIERELDFDLQIKRGFRPLVFASFKRNTRFSNKVLCRVLGVSERSVERMAAEDERIKPIVSDRLYRAAKVIAFAEEVFESRDAGLEWLETPQTGLVGKKPLDLIETEAGAREVEEELNRIEHGFVA
jgi:putative toxin-antitoxin system antitoxin component (TIGR02293 family)